MYKNLFIVATSIFAVFCMTFLVKVGKTQDASVRPQTGPESRFSKEDQDAANKILESPKAKYLSGSGRYALKMVSGGTSILEEIASRKQSLQADIPIEHIPFESSRFEIMVNDPARDLPDFDITSQTETAVAGYNDNIVVSYNNSTFFTTRRSITGYSLSSNGGATFTDLGAMPTSASGFNFGDPALTVDKSGNFYQAYVAFEPSRPSGFRFTVGVTKSIDGGRTFNPPALIPVGTLLRGSIEDKEFIAVDNTDGPYNGNVYVTFTNVNPDINFGVPIFLSRSTDGGVTFSTPVLVSSVQGFLDGSEFTQGSEPVVGPHGEIYVTYQSFSQTSFTVSIMVAKSTDGGGTFGSPVKVTDFDFIGSSTGKLTGFFVNSFPRIDINPVNGQVYITYASNPPGPDGADVFFTRSANGAATWSAPVRVNHDDTITDQFFPDIAVNNTGKIEIMWYDRRRDPANNVKLDIFRSDSTDGGLIFKPDRRVTSVSFVPTFSYDAIFSEDFMGDYNDIKAITRPNGKGEDFLLAWTDCRRLINSVGGPRHDQDVFFSRKRASDDDDIR